MFSNMQVTDDLDKNSSGGVKAVFEWTQERIREEPEPVCVCVCMRERERLDSWINLARILIATSKF